MCLPVIIARPGCTTPPYACRWFQYSLRKLLLFVLGSSIACSWLALNSESASTQRKAVSTIERSGGWVRYDYEYDGAGDLVPGAGPRHSAWLRELLGDDFFATVIEAAVYNDDGLKSVTELPRIRRLQIGKSPYCRADFGHVEDVRRHTMDAAEPKQRAQLLLRSTVITEAALEHIQGLPQLQDLAIFDVPLTNAGLEYLKTLRQLRRLRLPPRHGKLNLERAAITTEGVRNLEQALPNCEIDWNWPTSDER